MTRQFTRRQVAAALVTSAALSAQAPNNAPLPQNPGEELKAARDLLRQNLEQLAKFPLPMSTEPAVHFKA